MQHSIFSKKISSHLTLFLVLPGSVPRNGSFLKRFPYDVVVRDLGAEVLVIAFAHHSRRPGYWRDRGSTQPSYIRRGTPARSDAVARSVGRALSASCYLNSEASGTSKAIDRHRSISHIMQESTARANRAAATPVRFEDRGCARLPGDAQGFHWRRRRTDGLHPPSRVRD